MPNMGYCRFQNTLNDLEDVSEHMEDKDLSSDEKKARKNLIELCQLIAADAENNE
jgi:hypothetical protein